MGKWQERLSSLPRPVICRLLDVAEELIPVPETGDKYSNMANWIETLYREGLITIEEKWRIREEIANSL